MSYRLPPHKLALVASGRKLGAEGGEFCAQFRVGLPRNVKTSLLEAKCDNEYCPHEKHIRKSAERIDAKWDQNGFSWQYETPIPHSTFLVMEDGEPYCEGIVFALADVAP